MDIRFFFFFISVFGGEIFYIFEYVRFSNEQMLSAFVLTSILFTLNIRIDTSEQAAPKWNNLTRIYTDSNSVSTFHTCRKIVKWTF